MLGKTSFGIGKLMKIDHEVQGAKHVHVKISKNDQLQALLFQL
jgi:hypothetical protein